MEGTLLPTILPGLGIALAVGLSASGSATATVMAAQYLLYCDFSPMAVAPIIIAGVLAIYGMIIGVIISQTMNATNALTAHDGAKLFAGGLTVGLACLASGNGMTYFLSAYWYSDPSKRTNRSNVVDQVQEPLLDKNHEAKRLLIGAAPSLNLRFVLSLVFLEAIALYGLIVALVVIS